MDPLTSSSGNISLVGNIFNTRLKAEFQPAILWLRTASYKIKRDPRLHVGASNSNNSFRSPNLEFRIDICLGILSSSKKK